MSRFRSQKRILGVTNSVSVMRKMCLYWGITPFYFQEDEDVINEIHYQMMDVLTEKKLVKYGDKIVITHGDGTYFKEGTSNSLRVEIIKDIPRENLENISSKKIQEVEIEKGRIILDTSLCASCQSCVRTCPHSIWKISEDKDKMTYIDVDRAIECSKDMECVDACPTGAIEILTTDF